MADTATGIVIPSSNQLVIKGKRFQIILPDDLQAEAVFGEGSEICGPKQNYFFRLVMQFSEKLMEALYVGWRGHGNCNNFQNGA